MVNCKHSGSFSPFKKRVGAWLNRFLKDQLISIEMVMCWIEDWEHKYIAYMTSKDCKLGCWKRISCMHWNWLQNEIDCKHWQNLPQLPDSKLKNGGKFLAWGAATQRALNAKKERQRTLEQQHTMEVTTEAHNWSNNAKRNWWQRNKEGKRRWVEGKWRRVKFVKEPKGCIPSCTLDGGDSAIFMDGSDPRIPSYYDICTH